MHSDLLCCGWHAFFSSSSLFFVNVSLVVVLANPDPDALSYSASSELKHAVN